MNTVSKILFTILLLANIALLIIPSIGIAVGLTNRHLIQPVIAWAQDPGPMFVDDPRCCR